MVPKFPPFLCRNKFSTWVDRNLRFHAISTAARVQVPSENNQNAANFTQFDSSIHFLKRKLYPDALVSVLDSTNDLDSALKVFKWASAQKPFRHTTATYSRMALKLGIAGNVQEMEELLNEMVKITSPHEKEAAFVFGFLIESLCQSWRLNEALKVFMVMNLAKFQPSISTSCTLLFACVENKDFPSVLFVYKEIVKAGITPNVEILNCLIEALCETDRIDTALDQFCRIKKKGCSPNIRSFKIIISSLCLKNQVRESLQILHEMFELGTMPDCDFYNSIVPLLCKVNRLDEGIKLYRMMRASCISSNTIVSGTLIACCCENLQLDEATKLFSEVTEMGLSPEVEMYVNIVTGYCKLGRFSEAEAFLEGNSVSEVLPCNALLDGYCNVGRLSRAIIFLRKMIERNSCDNISWNILIRGLCEKGWIRKAFEVLNNMVIFSYTPDSATYSALICGFCKIWRYEDALELYSQVCAKDWCLDLITYSSLINTLCHSNKIQQAVEVFQYMSNKGYNLTSSSFNLLIGRICSMGRVEEAVRLRSFASYTGTSSCPSTYATIMLGPWKLNKANYVLVLLAQMLVEGCTLDSNVYCALINGLCAENRAKDAALFFDRMVSDSLAPNLETLNTFLSCMENHSQLHMVTHSLDKIMFKEGLVSSTTLNMVINGLWKEDHKREACNFLDRMLEMGWVPDAATHGLLIGNIAKEEIGSEVKNVSVCDKVSNILAEGLD